MGTLSSKAGSVNLDALIGLLADAVADRVVERIEGRDAGDDLLSIDEASALSGRGKRSIRDDIRAGRIPGFRAGRALRVRRADVLELVTKHARKPVAPAAVADDFDADDEHAARLGLVGRGRR